MRVQLALLSLEFYISQLNLGYVYLALILLLVGPQACSEVDSILSLQSNVPTKFSMQPEKVGGF